MVDVDESQTVVMTKDLTTPTKAVDNDTVENTMTKVSINNEDDQVEDEQPCIDVNDVNEDAATGEKEGEENEAEATTSNYSNSHQWEEYFERWKKYFDEHKNPIVDQDIDADLHRWCARVRHDYLWRNWGSTKKNPNSLKEQRFEILRKAGFSLEWKGMLPHEEEMWMSNFTQWVQYRNQNLTPHVSSANPRLFAWVNEQREDRLNKTKLSEKHLKMLEDEGFPWLSERECRKRNISTVLDASLILKKLGSNSNTASSHKKKKVNNVKREKFKQVKSNSRLFDVRKKSPSSRKGVKGSTVKTYSSFLNCNVAKYFDVAMEIWQVLFRGQVIKEHNKNGQYMYRVRYEDGDEEDVDAGEIRDICNLHEELEKKSSIDKVDVENGESSKNNGQEPLNDGEGENVEFRALLSRIKSLKRKVQERDTLIEDLQRQLSNKQLEIECIKRSTNEC
mmetsp:Transcript_4858/g.6566  ORF Transcript_4858/g.6566 Transcript_4858/m.6566 type:complete len:449 (-) Transcript_4858:95-1441(-)